MAQTGQARAVFSPGSARKREGPAEQMLDRARKPPCHDQSAPDQVALDQVADDQVADVQLVPDQVALL